MGGHWRIYCLVMAKSVLFRCFRSEFPELSVCHISSQYGSRLAFWMSTFTDLVLRCRLGWSAPTQTSTSSSRWRGALRSWRIRAESTWFTAGRLCCRPPPTSPWTTSCKVGRTAVVFTATVQRVLLVLLLSAILQLLALCLRWHFFLSFQTVVRL